MNSMNLVNTSPSLPLNIKVNLPDDVIDIILSYGDPIINQKYSFVMKQLEYLMNEFNYKRKNRFNTWHGYHEYHFKYYILYKNYSKRALNYCHIRCNRSFCNLHN